MQLQTGMVLRDIVMYARFVDSWEFSVAGALRRTVESVIALGHVYPATPVTSGGLFGARG
jgi:hypothetical protein